MRRHRPLPGASIARSHSTTPAGCGAVAFWPNSDNGSMETQARRDGSEARDFALLQSQDDHLWALNYGPFRAAESRSPLWVSGSQARCRSGESISNYVVGSLQDSLQFWTPGPTARGSEVWRETARRERSMRLSEEARSEASQRNPTRPLRLRAQKSHTRTCGDGQLAEGEGFEPPVRLPAQRFSRPPRSTTPASLRRVETVVIRLRRI